MVFKRFSLKYFRAYTPRGSVKRTLKATVKKLDERSAGSHVKGLKSLNPDSFKKVSTKVKGMKLGCMEFLCTTDSIDGSGSMVINNAVMEYSINEKSTIFLRICRLPYFLY
jgi:hypothetical protein